jgi:hypothetical protein
MARSLAGPARIGCYWNRKLLEPVRIANLKINNARRFSCENFRLMQTRPSQNID